MRIQVSRWLLALTGAALSLALLLSAALAAAPQQASPMVMTATNAKFGTILVNSAGRTLYTLSSEANGTISCTAASSCTAAWPPLLLPAGTTTPTAGPGVTGTLGTVARPEGGTQVTYNGVPLYTFAGDSAPGDATGDGNTSFGGTWHVVALSATTPSTSPTPTTPAPVTTPVVAPTTAPGAPLVQVANNLTLGPVLTTASGLTLYFNTAEAGGKRVCTGKCLGVWPPLEVPAGSSAPTAPAGVTGVLGTTSRPEGFTQVTYNGFPLYTFIKDTASGQTHGEGIQAFGGTWVAARAGAVPLSASAPAMLTIHISHSAQRVFGTVRVSFTWGSRGVRQMCAAAACHLGIPAGTSVHLLEIPRNAAARPFAGWLLAGAHAASTRSVWLTIRSNRTVSALYRAG